MSISGTGGGGQSQNVNIRDPWIGAQPYLQNIMQQGSSLYGQGAGSQVWGGPNVAAMDPTLQMALERTSQTALGAGPGAALPFASALNAIQSGGVTPGMQGALDVYGNVASGQNALNTGGIFADLVNRARTYNIDPNAMLRSNAQAFGNIANQAQGQNAGLLGQIGQIGSGANGININPQIQALFNQSQGQNADLGQILGTIAGGGGPIGTGSQWQDVANRAAGPTSTATNLAGIAAGQDISKNPYLSQLLDANAARIANRVNSAMSGAGRYGSFGQADALARTINETNLPLLNQNYEAERQRQLAANAQIDAAQRAAEASRMAGISGLTGVREQDIANQMGAANQLGGLRNAGTAMGSNLLSQIGGFQGQNLSNQLAALGLGGNLSNANIANALSALSGQGGAAANLAGSNRADIASALGAAQGLTGVQQQNIGNQMAGAGGLLSGLQNAQGQAINWAQLAPQLNSLMYDPSQRLGQVGQFMQGRSQQELDAQRQLFEQQQAMPWTQLSRYLGSVQGLGNIIGQAGTTTGAGSNTQSMGLNDWLKLGAGVGSLLFGSDRNLKTDIEEIGISETSGLPIYAYRYKGDPKTYPKVVGPMAQDIEAKYPGSTAMVGGKLVVLPHAAHLMRV